MRVIILSLCILLGVEVATANEYSKKINSFTMKAEAVFASIQKFTTGEMELVIDRLCHRPDVCSATFRDLDVTIVGIGVLERAPYADLKVEILNGSEAPDTLVKQICTMALAGLDGWSISNAEAAIDEAFDLTNGAGKYDQLHATTRIVVAVDPIFEEEKQCFLIQSYGQW